MNKICRNKLFYSLLVIVVVCLFSFNVAFAANDGWVEGSDFNFTPQINNIYCTTGDSFLYSNCYFEFDEEGAMVNNLLMYFTFEQNNATDGLSIDSTWTNIPDPHFDYEDDNNDGYEEEIEVCIEADGFKDQLVAEQEYYFTVWWENTTSTNHSGGTINYIAQRSVYSFFDYEAVDWDYLTSRSYSTVYAQ